MTPNGLRGFALSALRMSAQEHSGSSSIILAQHKRHLMPCQSYPEEAVRKLIAFFLWTKLKLNWLPSIKWAHASSPWASPPILPFSDTLMHPHPCSRSEPESHCNRNSPARKRRWPSSAPAIARSPEQSLQQNWLETFQQKASPSSQVWHGASIAQRIRPLSRLEPSQPLPEASTPSTQKKIWSFLQR